MESSESIERRDLRPLCCTSRVIGSGIFLLKSVISLSSPGRGLRPQSPERKRVSLPRPDRMVQAALACGISPSEKRTLDLIADHPMIHTRTLPSVWVYGSGTSASLCIAS